MSTFAGLPCITRGWTSTGGSSPSSSLMTWISSSAVRWLSSGTYRSDTLTLPAGGISVCSQTFSTTRSDPWSRASAAAQVKAVRLPGDPSTPTTMVFHCLTVVSSSSVDVPALLRLFGSRTLMQGIRPVESLYRAMEVVLRVAGGGVSVPPQCDRDLFRRRGRHDDDKADRTGIGLARRGAGRSQAVDVDRRPVDDEPRFLRGSIQLRPHPVGGEPAFPPDRGGARRAPDPQPRGPGHRSAHPAADRRDQ